MWFSKTPSSTSTPDALDRRAEPTGAEPATDSSRAAQDARAQHLGGVPGPRMNSGTGASSQGAESMYRHAVGASHSVMGRSAITSEALAPIREMDDATTAGLQARMQALPNSTFARLANELTLAFRFEQQASGLAAHATSMVRQHPMAVMGLLRESELRASRAASIWWSPVYQVMLSEVARRWDMRPEQYGAVVYLAPDPVDARERIESQLIPLVLDALPHLASAFRRVEIRPTPSQQLYEHLGITQAFVGKHDFAAAFDSFMANVG